jgi:hypothetical protein
MLDVAATVYMAGRAASPMAGTPTVAPRSDLHLLQLLLPELPLLALLRESLNALGQR